MRTWHVVFRPLHALVLSVGVVVMLTASSRLLAQATSQPRSVSEWTPDDLLLSEDSRDFTISPDGRRVAWVKAAMTKTTGRTASNLYLSDVHGAGAASAALQLTTGNYVTSAPRWSPDGEYIAFLSSRALPDSSHSAIHDAIHDAAHDPASAQLWLVNMHGGEPRRLTSTEREIDDYAWASRDTILFLAKAEPTAYDRDLKLRKDDSRVIDDSAHEAPVRVFALAVSTGKTRQLSANGDWISRFAVSPDGRRVVTVHDRSLSWGYDQKIPPVTRLTDRRAGTSREIFDGTHIVPDDITWARDGSGFYFTNDSTTSPRYRTATLTVLDYYDLASGRALPVEHAWMRGVSGNLRAVRDGIVATLNDGVHVVPARYVRQGTHWARHTLAGARVANSFDMDVSVDGRSIVYRYTRANVPPQLYGAALQDERITGGAQLTDLNPSFAAKLQPRVEIVHWKGANDEQVEGILTYPLGYIDGKRYPLVLTIHGGPALADLDEWKQTWSYPRLLFNQRGAFTLQVNYHGSSRYGLKWVESICCGKIYDAETPDLERGVDYVIARGLADPDKLGTLGHSYGAILTTQLTTVDTRFKAASAAAGDVEWFSDWGGVSFGASYDNYYFGASPWENPQLYVRKSPVFRLQNVRTPTIIYHGTDDTNVPVGQAWTYFRTLQQLGKAPVRLILFPGEPHSPRKYVHQHRKIDEDLAWFDQYLFGATRASDPAVDSKPARGSDSTRSTPSVRSGNIPERMH